MLSLSALGVPLMLLRLPHSLHRADPVCAGPAASHRGWPEVRGGPGQAHSDGVDAPAGRAEPRERWGVHCHGQGAQLHRPWWPVHDRGADSTEQVPAGAVRSAAVFCY